ncbi:hypothetical protein JCGZ_05057 [Jatropha curcas]|uniref:Uncharacterized protein n=1 Tax=Jatropha curcas TaxID=180498 RepID=A0A067J9U1_JATCU|nr:hypothetical protein JCGZ_05057 [Jatropha curcas]
MARGRAVDSNASASSSTQPPVPPSLPSVPSSSNPLPGPIESSPASQSPTALVTPLPGPIESSPASQSPTALEAFRMGRGYYGYAKCGLGEIMRSMIC